jgi:hypothetical protein
MDAPVASRTGKHGPRRVVHRADSRSCLGSNVRSRVYRPVWDRLRRAAYAAAGNICELCGGVGRQHPVECHEVWEYDESRRVQRLVRLIALCPACHAVKHYGRMMSMGRAEEAAAHLMAVNGWDRETTRAHVQEAFETWRRRSQGRGRWISPPWSSLRRRSARSSRRLGVSCRADRWRSVMLVLSWDALRGASTRQRIGLLPCPRQGASCRAPLTRVVADITVAGVQA